MRLNIIVLLFLLSTQVFAQTTPVQRQLYKDGLDLYNRQNYIEAREVFSRLLADSTFAANDSVFYYWTKSKIGAGDITGVDNIVKQLSANFPASPLIKNLQQQVSSGLVPGAGSAPRVNAPPQKQIDFAARQSMLNSSTPAATPEPWAAYIQPVTNYDDQPKVSNMFYETDLRQAVQDLATEAQIPVVVDNSVQGYVSMEISNMPFEKALQRILSVGNFTYKKIEDYYLVGAADPRNPSFALLSTAASIKLNYLPVAKAINLLSEYYTEFVKANDVTNTLVVTASPAIIAKLREDLRQIDVPPRQVMLEAIVTEIKNDGMKSIGIDWKTLMDKGDKNFSGNVNLSTGMVDTLSSFLSFIRNESGILKGDPFTLVTSLNALGTSDKAEIKATPRVVTTNAQPATIYIAKEQYFSMVTGPLSYPYTKLEQVSVGIKLEITPYISDNGEITVNIKQEVSDAVSQGREGLPLVDRRTVTSTVRVKNGETIAIGGLTQHTSRKVQNKIPFLGDIPILGYLFSHTKWVKIKTDVMVFIKPTIIIDN